MSLRAAMFTVFMGLSVSAVAQRGDVWLELPAVGLHVPSGQAAVVSTAHVPMLRIHLMRQPDEVAYSRITSWVNAASANIVATERATDEGIVCTLDLGSNPGLALHPGRNSVELTFKDRWNEAHYASFILQLPMERMGPPAHSPQAPFGGAQRYAIVAGVAKYKFGGRGIQNIAYADQDAAAFRREIISPRGGNVPEQHLQFLINEDATSDHIREALQKLSSVARANDVVFLYLNMNGSYDPQDPEHKYLLAYDSDPDDMRNTAIPVASLPGLLGSGEGTPHVVVFSDSSHADTPGSPAPGKINPANLANLYLLRAFSLEGHAAMEAADIRQTSQQGARWNGGGAFTYFLMEGMEGHADFNHDGTVTVRELFSYVQQKVAESTMDTQLPMLSSGHSADVAVSGVATAPRSH